MKALAIIPARGGSKRIPRKNIKGFLGKPIIAYSIEAALQSQLFDEVMVSTDDDEIASVAQAYGAKVPFLRSSKNANDYAVLADVVSEVLKCYSQYHMDFEKVCCVLPTAPFLKGEILKSAFSALANSSADSIMSVAQLPCSIYRTFSKDDAGHLKFNFPNHLQSRSQDFNEDFYDAGQFYITKTKVFFQEKRLSGGKLLPFILPTSIVQDIDTIDDWQTAEFKYKVQSI